MKVIAIAAAFYNGSRVRVGDVVDVPEGFKASWASPPEGVKQSDKPGKAARQEPRSLSQSGKAESKTFVQAHNNLA